MTDTMRAAVYHGQGDLRIESRPVPEPEGDEVLIAVSHCGICGTDLHSVVEGWGQPGAIPGHELSGEVVAVGPDADVEVGALVTAEPQNPCGTCEPCRRGRPSLCTSLDRFTAIPEGAFAEFTKVHAGQLRPLPDGLDLRTAALAEPLAVSLHALTNGGHEPGQRVLVTGGGPIGQLAVAAMRARGDGAEGRPRTRIVVSEPAPARRDRALRVGADEVVTPDDLPFPRMPMELVDEPFDLVLECAGRASAIEQGLANLRWAGTLVIVGSGLQPPSVDPNRILLNELVLTGSFNYDASGFDDALALLASGRLPVDDLVEPDDVPLDGMLEAMHRLHQGELTRKVLVTPT